MSIVEREWTRRLVAPRPVAFGPWFAGALRDFPFLSEEELGAIALLVAALDIPTLNSTTSTLSTGRQSFVADVVSRIDSTVLVEVGWDPARVSLGAVRSDETWAGDWSFSVPLKPSSGSHVEVPIFRTTDGLIANGSALKSIRTRVMDVLHLGPEMMLVPGAPNLKLRLREVTASASLPFSHDYMDAEPEGFRADLTVEIPASAVASAFRATMLSVEPSPIDNVTVFSLSPRGGLDGGAVLVISTGPSATRLVMRPPFVTDPISSMRWRRRLVRTLDLVRQVLQPDYGPAVVPLVRAWAKFHTSARNPDLSRDWTETFGKEAPGRQLMLEANSWMPTVMLIRTKSRIDVDAVAMRALDSVALRKRTSTRGFTPSTQMRNRMFGSRRPARLASGGDWYPFVRFTCSDDCSDGSVGEAEPGRPFFWEVGFRVPSSSEGDITLRISAISHCFGIIWYAQELAEYLDAFAAIVERLDPSCSVHTLYARTPVAETSGI